MRFATKFALVVAVPLAVIAVRSIASRSASSRGPQPTTSAATTIAFNTNRQSAGKLANGVLTLSLEARSGGWQPNGAAGPTITTAAFAESGGALQTPGPLVRVPVGTEIHATVHNSLTKALWMYGFGAQRGASDSVQIKPGTSHEFRFTVREAGAFWYAARTDSFPLMGRLAEDTQLGGALIVDPPGVVAPDRIFVVSGYATLDSTKQSGLGDTTVLTFNGASYPNTERLSMRQGDTTHWRFVNLSALEHPLHLHGSYFRVDTHGDGVRDTVYANAAQRMAVTELLTQGSTMTLSFAPPSAGNWIFHCHIASHITAIPSLERDWTAMSQAPATDAQAMPGMTGAGTSDHGSMDHRMDGLVMQFVVTPSGPAPNVGSTERPIRLVIRSKAGVYGKHPGYSIGQEAPNAAAPASLTVPGPLLDLIRGERVAITLVNRSHERAAIHWHGIELESYPDGVPGISGDESHVLPFIAPGDSLTVRFTPPRAGTFMYHSHSNEMQQISSGIYGPIVVHDRAEPLDASRDRVLLLSDNGPDILLVKLEGLPDALLNGQHDPSPLALPRNIPIRLRLINIRSEAAMSYEFTDGDKPVTWRVLAKDGFPKPSTQMQTRAASVVLNPGEIIDVEVTVPDGATRAFRYGIAGVPPKLARAVSVPVTAR